MLHWTHLEEVRLGRALDGLLRDDEHVHLVVTTGVNGDNNAALDPPQGSTSGASPRWSPS